MDTVRLTQAQKDIMNAIAALGSASRQKLLETAKHLSTPCIDANLKILAQLGLLCVKKERQARKQHDEKHSALVNVYRVNPAHHNSPSEAARSPCEPC